MNHEDLKERLRIDLSKLKLLRDKESELKENYNKIKQMFEEANHLIIDNLKSTSDKKAELEDTIRKNAVEIYGKTGSKQLYGGIGIQIRKILEYNPKVALEWAQGHNLCLMLDKKAFENIAKTQEITLDDKKIVSIREVPSATLPSEIKEEV